MEKSTIRGASEGIHQTDDRTTSSHILAPISPKKILTQIAAKREEHKSHKKSSKNPENRKTRKETNLNSRIESSRTQGG